VISSTVEIQDGLLARYPQAPRERFTVIPNGFDSADFPQQPDIPAAPSPAEPMTVAYFGSLYSNRDPRPLFEALRILKADGIGSDRLRIQHFGPPNARAEAAARAAGVADMFESLGKLPYRDGLLRMRSVSALLILGADDTDRFCVATKTYEYLWARRPILALVPRGPIQRLVEEEGCGRAVSPADVAAISDAVRAFLRDHAAGRLGSTASRAVDRFDRKSLTREFASVLGQVSGHRTARARTTNRHRSTVRRPHGESHETVSIGQPMKSESISRVLA
jgi:glycosyltransferase involved in cell wall biosynthesis